MTGSVNLDQQSKKVIVGSFELENAVVFNYFNNIPVQERTDKLLRAIYIGILALMEDRISTFLSKTANELGTELESLKIIFDLKKELFLKTSIKGTLAEEGVSEFLNQYFSERHLKDRAFLIGNSTGKLPRNKTGDILCEVDGRPDLKIVLECKFDKSIRLGDISARDLTTRKSDTAWSQLIEAQANRDAKIAIVVFDVSLVDASITKEYENVGYVPGLGFVSIIDSQSGDYSNLAIAYMLARDIALKSLSISELDKDLLSIIVNKIIRDINEIVTIRSLVESNIQSSRQILRQLEKSLLLMQFNQEYLEKFLIDGSLTKNDLLAFYMGDEVREKYRMIEKEISEY